MVLSTEEYADIRFVTGAQGATVFSDTQIQTQYDLAVTDAPEDALILPYCYVYILRRLWGYQRLMASRTTDFGDRQERIQVKDNSKELLDYWEGQAGLEGGGKISMGAIDLGIDTECDDASV